MATKGEATLIVTLVDKATAGLNKVKSAISTLKGHWLTITAAMAGVTAVVAASIHAFSEQENAINKLNTALENQGIFSKKASDDLVQFAGSLSKTTLFADETIVEMQALLTTFGLAETPLKNTTKAALDLATGLGVDLRTATLILGKAAAGETGTLGRYGIKISETIPPGQKLAAVLEAVTSRFGGAAQAATLTFSGRVEVLKIRIGELAERLGAFLIGPAGKLVSWAEKAAGFMEKASANFEQMLGNELGRKKARLAQINEALSSIGNNRFLGIITDADELNKLLAEQKKLLGEIKVLQDSKRAPDSGGPLPPDRSGTPGVDEAHAKELERLKEQARAKIDQFTMTQDEIASKEADHLASRLIAQGQYELAVDLMRSASHAKEKKQLEDRKQAGLKALSDLATLQNSKNKEMAAVGKAAAITRATIDTYVGATAAYQAMAGIPIIGPALGIAAAAAAIAAGMSNVAAIRGTPMKTGGVVLPTMGGTLATIGEGGKSEAVIPLGDRKAQEQIREAMGGGELSITINIGVLSGDRQAAHELARTIDEELFRLGRNRKSTI